VGRSSSTQTELRRNFCRPLRPLGALPSAQDDIDVLLGTTTAQGDRYNVIKVLISPLVPLVCSPLCFGTIWCYQVRCFCHISGVLGGCDALLFAAIADPTQEETPRKNTRVFSPDSGEGRKGEIEMDKRPERRGKMTSGWKSGLRVARSSGGAQAPCRLASV